MNSRPSSSSGFTTRRTRAVLAGLLLGAGAFLHDAAAQAPPPSAAQAPAPSAPKRNIGGPGDYPLREKLVHFLTLDQDLAKEHFTIVLVNGGAVFSGPIKSYALKKRALTIAASLRGIVNVTDEMEVPRGTVPDAELARAATSALGDAAESLELKNLGVEVTDGVLTMSGTVKNVESRGRAEEIAGTVLGVVRISNHLLPADAPAGEDDATLKRAVADYLGDFHVFNYPSDLTVAVANGVVTLKGTTRLCLGRQAAGLVASLVKGVVRVDNRIKTDPSLPPRTRSVKAEK